MVAFELLIGLIPIRARGMFFVGAISEVGVYLNLFEKRSGCLALRLIFDFVGELVVRDAVDVRSSVEAVTVS